MSGADANRKIAYVLSNLRHAPMFERKAEALRARGFELSFALLNAEPSPLGEALKAQGHPVLHIPYRGKKDLPAATARLAASFARLRPGIVHAHLMDACLAALPAARIAGIPRRIHTRHHSNLHHEHYRHAVAYDRLVNMLSTEIVATCRNVEHVLKDLDRANPAKVRVIHFGFDFSPYDSVSGERVEGLRQKHGLGGRRPVIGVISRYMKYKGLQHVIPAFERVLERHPEACLFLANTTGQEYAREIRMLLRGLPESSYREVPFETDAPALYGLFDVFVHAPIDAVSEAFGQVYVEALAAARPCVFTLSGIANEFVRDEVNALAAPFQDSQGIGDRILRLLDDAGLAGKLGAQGSRDVRERFPFDRMIDLLCRLYEGSLSP